MRMPEEGEDLTGKVCVCSVGRPFIVVGQQPFVFGKKVDGSDNEVMCWVGLGLDGKGTAASSNPCVIAESGEEFYDKLTRRFGGKMEYSG